MDLVLLLLAYLVPLKLQTYINYCILHIQHVGFLYFGMKGPPLIYNFKWVGILNVNLTVRKRDSKETATAATAIHQQGALEVFEVR